MSSISAWRVLLWQSFHKRRWCKFTFKINAANVFRSDFPGRFLFNSPFSLVFFFQSYTFSTLYKALRFWLLYEVQLLFRGEIFLIFLLFVSRFAEALGLHIKLSSSFYIARKRRNHLSECLYITRHCVQMGGSLLFFKKKIETSPTLIESRKVEGKEWSQFRANCRLKLKRNDRLSPFAFETYFALKCWTP